MPAAPGPASVARADDPAALDDLLRAQDDDGRWKARGAAAGHDEGATGLAVLALVSEALGADRPEALRTGPVAQAVGRATRWLAGRASVDPDARPGAAAARDQALATAALLEVYAATHDASLRPSVDRAVRALSRRAERPDAEAWTAQTLARAEALGWHRGGTAGEARGTTRAAAPWPLGSDGSPCAQALAVLAAGARG